MESELTELKPEYDNAKQVLKTDIKEYQDNSYFEVKVKYEKIFKTYKEFNLLEANYKSCELLFKQIEELEKELYRENERTD